MTTRVSRVLAVSAGAVMLCLVTSVFAQAPAAGSASEAYLKYRKAFDGAKKIDELLPYMVAARRKDVESTPAAERAEMFDMIKTMGALTNLKVVKETPAGNEATLTVEALDSDKAKSTGTIQMVKEGGSWKVGKESWKSGN